MGEKLFVLTMVALLVLLTVFIIVQANNEHKFSMLEEDFKDLDNELKVFKFEQREEWVSQAQYNNITKIVAEYVVYITGDKR